jgi:hypothetical protein
VTAVGDAGDGERLGHDGSFTWQAAGVDSNEVTGVLPKRLWAHRAV